MHGVSYRWHEIQSYAAVCDSFLQLTKGIVSTGDYATKAERRTAGCGSCLTRAWSAVEAQQVAQRDVTR
jgi:hypothetical protein